MKKISRASVISVITFALTGILGACSDENPWSSQSVDEGKISLSLHTNTDIERAIPQITRATAPDIPRADEFQIKLERLDGTWSATYPSLAEFNKVESFKTGSYNITAFYGSPDEEGFGKCYYEGSEQITIHQEHTTEASITATLANSIVNIEYSPEFQNYFAGWGAKLHSEGNDYLVMAPDETRPVYIAPGEIEIYLELRRQDGKETSLIGANFVALPRHQYNVKFTLNNDNEGATQIEIIFDDSLTQENVTIDLTEELFNVRVPVISPTGFMSGDSMEILQGNAAQTTTMMSVEALGELQQAILTVDSHSYTPPFGNEIDLCNITDIQQSQVESSGILAKGFFKNPGQMALLDLTQFAAHLPVGNHTVTLVAVDKLNRSSQPVSLSFDVQPVELNAVADTHMLGTRRVDVTVTYNGFNPLEDLSFKVQDNLGQYVKASIIEIKDNSTRGFDSNQYTLTLSLPATQRPSIPATMYLKGEEYSNFEIEVEVPEYTLVSDIFSNYSRIKVSKVDLPATYSTALEDVTNALLINLSGPNQDNIVITRDAKAGMITLHGLTPGSNYLATHQLTTNGEITSRSFTTEAQAQLPNSDFEQTHQTINLSNVQIGGQYNVSANYTLYADIRINEPTGWTSINDKTAWSGASNLNTWFVVPSTIAENGTVKIRSVAYDHNGTTPARSGGAFNTSYYCTNTPSSFSSRSAGELFLGTYSFDGTEHRTDGIAFTSRPSAISFDYSYITPTECTNEKGVVIIKILDSTGSVLVEKTEQLQNRSDMGNYTVNLPSYPFGRKGAKIIVNFKSSSSNPPATHVPTGSELNEHQTLGNHRNITNYHALSTGAELTIDNIVLHYEDPTAPSNAAKRKNRATKKTKK